MYGLDVIELIIVEMKPSELKYEKCKMRYVIDF